MSKKVIKNILLVAILLILVLSIILIPLLVNASKEYGEIPKLDNVAIEEANQKEIERELAYKEQWAKEHKNNSNIEILNEKVLNDSSSETDEIMETAKQEAEYKSERQNNIIKQYYPEEYERITKSINEYYNNSFIIDLQNSTLSEGERELYNLVLNILENENLPDEDATLLKDYISSQMFNIKKDNILKTRADKVLE